MMKKPLLLSMALALIGATPMCAAGPSFHPDVMFSGSSLSGWRTLGQANWHAENGEITGKAESPSGGWLMLDHSYQDVALFANFKCSGGCEAGALFRAEKTADGWTGIFVSLTEADTPSYRVTLDGEGKILTRDRLRRGGGLIRVAPGPSPTAPPVQSARPSYNVKLPFTRRDTSLRANEWNEI